MNSPNRNKPQGTFGFIDRSSSNRQFDDRDENRPKQSDQCDVSSTEGSLALRYNGNNAARLSSNDKDHSTLVSYPELSRLKEDLVFAQSLTERLATELKSSNQRLYQKNRQCAALSNFVMDANKNLYLEFGNKDPSKVTTILQKFAFFVQELRFQRNMLKSDFEVMMADSLENLARIGTEVRLFALPAEFHGHARSSLGFLVEMEKNGLSEHRTPESGHSDPSAGQDPTTSSSGVMSYSYIQAICELNRLKLTMEKLREENATMRFKTEGQLTLTDTSNGVNFSVKSPSTNSPEHEAVTSSIDECLNCRKLSRAVESFRITTRKTAGRLSALQAEVEDGKLKVEHLNAFKEEAEEAKGKVIEMFNRCEKLENEMKRLRISSALPECSKHEADIADLNAEKERLQSELTGLQSSIKRLQTAKSVQQEMLDGIDKSLNNEISAHAETTSKLQFEQQRYGEIYHQYNLLMTKYNDRKREKEEFLVEKEQRDKKFEELTKSNDEHATKIRELDSAIAAKEKEVEYLQKQIKAKTEELKSSEQKLKALREKAQICNESSSILQQKDEEIAELTKQLVLSRAELQEAQGKEKLNRRTFQKYRTENDAQKKCIVQLDEEKKLLTIDVQRLEKESSEKQSELEGLRQRNAKARLRSKRAAARLQKAVTAKSQTDARLNRLRLYAQACRLTRLKVLKSKMHLLRDVERKNVAMEAKVEFKRQELRTSRTECISLDRKNHELVLKIEKERKEFEEKLAGIMGVLMSQREHAGPSSRQ